MPLITCELRWFFEGLVPAEVEAWFACGRPQAEPAREDRYLMLPGVTGMGIKAREGRLEIKGRTAELGHHAIAPGIEGVAERWCKWSYDAVVEARMHRLIQDHGVIMTKARAQRFYLLIVGGSAQQTTERDLIRRGFSLELTRIRLGDADHWTLGVEAAGAEAAPDDDTLLADLLHALHDVLYGFPLSLPRARSMSYPGWLAR
jgi:hypothetical protein